MFTPVLLVFLLCRISAESVTVKYRCEVSSNETAVTTFSPSSDGVRGRYTAELCAQHNSNMTNLTINLTYNDNKNVCNRTRKHRWYTRPGHQHSSNTVDITNLTNCTRVCYAMDFDMIFSGCYEIKSTFTEGKRSGAPFDSYHLINNSISKEDYDKNKPNINFVNHDDWVSLHWYLGIPLVDYNVTLHRTDSKQEQEYLSQAEVVTQNCSVMENVEELFCELSPEYGCYQAILEHGGLWTSGIFTDMRFVKYSFCHQAAAAPSLRARGGAGWGGALLAAAALAAALALHRALRRRSYHKRMLDIMFRNRFSEPETPAPAPAMPESRDILLLYAREGDLGQEVVDALKDLITETTGAKIYDLFSAEVVAALGAAPGAWLRGVLAGPARVLLLQGPALHALYDLRLQGDHRGLTLAAPGRGRRAMYRRPAVGDDLLAAALRQLADTPHRHHHYHKYYLATVSGLETDILPSVVPYRRYLLPEAARVLLADLGGAPAGGGPAGGGGQPVPAAGGDGGAGVARGGPAGLPARRTHPAATRPLAHHSPRTEVSIYTSISSYSKRPRSAIGDKLTCT
ncbi:uncharacterized protein LOC111348235 [Spodoptera litura]|uniref:Uncharacterized protein LOC111348235 n=1 Tax=Spodoptera litura TaxID=69820 RepID=A0A9J7IHM9_SPOLT|nr:uncharacterized protein LOC111348235 [Spodoptera litura]